MGSHVHIGPIAICVGARLNGFHIQGSMTGAQEATDHDRLPVSFLSQYLLSVLKPHHLLSVVGMETALIMGDLDNFLFSWMQLRLDFFPIGAIPILIVNLLKFAHSLVHLHHECTPLLPIFLHILSLMAIHVDVLMMFVESEAP